MQRTPLHDNHVALGAHMVDFAGWHMPLNYGSQIQEHHIVRRSVGLFDVSHMLAVDIEGLQAFTDLRRLLANDVERLSGSPGAALYSCMLNAEAGVVDDLLVYGLAPDKFRLVLNAARAVEDIQWLQTRVSPKVRVHPRVGEAILALQGPEAAACIAATLKDSTLPTRLKSFHSIIRGNMLIARTGYTGEDGFEIMLPGAEAVALWQGFLAQGAKPVGLAARDTLRLEAGLMLYGQDLDEEHTPLECGLSWSVRMNDDRQFVGRSALETKTSLCKMVGLVLEERGMLRQGHLVTTPDGEGVVTSGSYSPTLERSIALAQVPIAVKIGDLVRVHLRHRSLESQARVVKPPFVRFGKILVPYDLNKKSH